MEKKSELTFPRVFFASGRRVRSCVRVGGFTLIELLVVVAIIAILAAIAIPNMLEAQTRAKVATAKNNLRVVSTGLEVYRVDHHGYPPMRSSLPSDPFGLLADRQLRCLTTPVAYLSPGAFHDPFGSIQQRLFLSSRFGRTALQQVGDTELPIPMTVNPNRSLLYYHYHSLARLFEAPFLGIEGVAVISIGPDRRDSFSVFAPFPAALPLAARQQGIRAGVDTLYDPTNGTVSEGDIPRFIGVVGRSYLP